MKKDDDVVARLGRNVARLRKARKMTLADVAKRGGLHWRHVQKIERGGANVNLATVAKLANAFGVEMRTLLGPSRPRARAERRAR